MESPLCLRHNPSEYHEALNKSSEKREASSQETYFIALEAGEMLFSEILDLEAQFLIHGAADDESNRYVM